MTDKEKLHQILSSLWKNDDSVGKTYYNQALQDVQTAIDLQEEPVSDGLEEAANDYAHDLLHDDVFETFIAGAQWQKEHLWKPADGDDLPEIDREVIVLCKNGRVAFGHRPVEKFIARPIGYGRTEEYKVETYDKGGWNIPNIVYWLDVELPKEIEP